ncbi:hypothetical protein JVT61DRAFT_11139 [Boletus reticuloceps]|uniref:Uncharacterized protein n=1 Tax=Boletus reticuloceps TaxID=495285 RepID=A0A8I3A5M2_9AGAM|nr:hypothetical protein JVT61DRAFT_11139 [Boletus reticuloceps]
MVGTWSSIPVTTKSRSHHHTTITLSSAHTTHTAALELTVTDAQAQGHNSLRRHCYLRFKLFPRPLPPPTFLHCALSSVCAMTNTWASSPLPSLGPLSSESASSHSALTLPYRLWDAYVTYLWHYQPSSWVSRVASTFRILALVLVLPVVLLTLLDVISYVIARTLGVVDDGKASTSDTADERRATVTVAVPVSERVPTAFSSEGPVRGSEGLAPEDSEEAQSGEDGHGHCDVSETAVRAVPAALRKQAQNPGQIQQIGTQTRAHAPDALPHQYYFAGEDDLRLAGEGVFSPAVSGPPSPITPRMPLHTFTENDGRGSGQTSEEEGIVLRRRVQGLREDELVHT